MKRFFVFCLVLLLSVPVLLPTTRAEEAPSYQTSDWAYADVGKAIQALNFMYIPHNGDFRQAISRWDFSEKAAALAAIEFGSNLKSYYTIMNYRTCAETGEVISYYGTKVAYDLGILKGRENGDLYPYADITRQEAAVMLARTYRVYHDTEPEILQPLSYSDQNEIADWALHDIQLMTQLGIMNGVEGNRFAPQEPYTWEQSLITLLRLHEKAPNDGFQGKNPFVIKKIEGGFLKVWKETDSGNGFYEYPFSLETDQYYICVTDSGREGVNSGPYEIRIIEQDFSFRSYPVPILEGDSNRGEVRARPENPRISEDGTKLFYTATLKNDAYRVYWDTAGNLHEDLIFPKGIYSVTMDLKTGEQTYTRADLPKS